MDKIYEKAIFKKLDIRQLKIELIFLFLKGRNEKKALFFLLFKKNLINM